MKFLTTFFFRQTIRHGAVMNWYQIDRYGDDDWYISIDLSMYIYIIRMYRHHNFVNWNWIEFKKKPSIVLKWESQITWTTARNWNTIISFKNPRNNLTHIHTHTHTYIISINKTSTKLNELTFMYDLQLMPGFIHNHHHCICVRLSIVVILLMFVCRIY